MVDPFEYIASLTGATPDQIKVLAAVSSVYVD